MQLRPLDPGLPSIGRLSVSAAPSVRTNLFTVKAQEVPALLESLGGRCELDEAAARLHIHTTSSRDWRELRLSELRYLAVGG